MDQFIEKLKKELSMGCFDKTCCLSNTAISADEECVLVILDERRRMKRFYDLISSVHRQADRESQELAPHEKEMVKGSGFIQIGDILPVKYLIKGTYNEYGSIKEEENLPEQNAEINAQFYHKWAFEYATGEDIEQSLKHPIKAVEKLYEFMFYMRKSPTDLEISGQQHKDSQEAKDMISFNERIKEYLNSYKYDI